MSSGLGQTSSAYEGVGMVSVAGNLRLLYAAEHFKGCTHANGQLPRMLAVVPKLALQYIISTPAKLRGHVDE